MKDIKICVLGGDLRMLSALSYMGQKGYRISVFGIDADIENAVKCTDLKTAVNNASAVILPLPFSADGIKVFTPMYDKDIKLDELYSLLNQDQLVAGGRLTESFCEKVRQKGCTCFDYYLSEKLTVQNAVPTAEGALAIAINETDITLFGSECCVFGYGRIGRILTRMLKNMGADVTVFARSPQALTWAEVEGANAVDLRCASKHITDTDIIFNTVPAKVINKDILDNTKRNVLIIDLASAPGGVDATYAKSLKRKVIFALSLPGKVAPKTAGHLIADCILDAMEGGIV